jgi:secreted Zn-dependent insulinase-like peptidase
MLKEAGVQEWVWNEIREMNEVEFRFQDKQKPSEFVLKTSLKLDVS